MAAEAEIKRARELVLTHGWNATCYQILNPGFELWFSDGGDAVVGYVEHRGRRIVGGAPVSAAERLRDVSAEFERDARRAGFRTVYFGAESRLERMYRGEPEYSALYLGSQPVLDPRGWTDRIVRHASLRGQLHRAENKGVTVEEWPSDRATDDAGLRRCLDEWLRSRGLPPLHFLIETDTLSRVLDRRIFVAMRRDAPVAFLVASPIPQRNGWLVEQLVRGDGSVNGVSELLVDAMMRAVATDGSGYVSLGLAPLSESGGSSSATGGRPVDADASAADRNSPDVDNPPWLSMVLAWMRAHGRRFYNFQGLEAYKAKFEPDRWDPVYAVVNQDRVGPSVLYAVTAAFADGSPAALILRALWKAVGTEARTALDVIGVSR